MTTAKRTVKAKVVLSVEIDYDAWCAGYGNEGADHVRAYLRSNSALAVSEFAVGKDIPIRVSLLNSRPGDWA